MNLTPQEYYTMTPAEFFLKLRGFNRTNWKEWEHTRVIAYTTASTVPSKHRLPRMARWMPLPTDEKSVINNDELKDFFAKLKERQKDA